MPNSTTVMPGGQASATQYNNLRSDVLDPTTGHGHDGADGRAIIAILFGDGSDGDVTISSGTTTLSRDMRYRNLTINAGAVLDANGYRVFVSGTLTLNGKLARAKPAKVNGATGGFGGVAGGSPSAPPQAVSVPLASPGALGAAGPFGSNVNVTTNGGAGNSVAAVEGAGWGQLVASAQAGAGGAGGASGQGQTGGAGGTVGAVTFTPTLPVAGGPFDLVGLLLPGTRFAGGAASQLQTYTTGSAQGGASGGSGGAASAQSAPGGSGGAGGTAGGALVVCAAVLSGAGVVEAQGGDGGNGGAGYGPPTGVNGGGGGGGGGGNGGAGGIAIVVYRRKLSWTGTYDVSGGAGGTGGAGGAGLGTGSAGVAGGNGGAGAAGRVFEVQL